MKIRCKNHTDILQSFYKEEDRGKLVDVVPGGTAIMSKKLQYEMRHAFSPVEVKNVLKKGK